MPNTEHLLTTITLLDSPDLSKYPNNLGNELNYYEHLGNLQNLQADIQVHRRTIAKTPSSSKDLLDHYKNLGKQLWIRFLCLGNLQDLQESIVVYQRAIAEAPSDFPDLPMYHNNLAVVLSKRYERLGDLTDLQKSIEAYEKSVALTPLNSPNLPMYLNNLGNGLRDRYSRLGDLNDLQASINACQRAADIAPSDSPNLPSLLNSLGNGLRDRYLRLGALEDLQASINACQQSVSLTPADSSDLPLYLRNLGNGLRNCYGHLGSVEDLQASIEKYEEAIAKTPLNSPVLPILLDSWGSGLRDRYSHLDDLNDLQAGIKAYQEAVDTTPPDSPALPSRLNNLGAGLSDRYSRLGDLNDLQAGIDAFQQASELEGPLSERLRAARNWLNWAFERDSWLEIEKIYPKIQKFSKELVEKQFLREHREAFLADTEGLAVKVAYSRIQTDHLPKAAEALEQGAAQLLSAALMRSRADLTQLQQDAPTLATAYQQQVAALQNAERAYQHAPAEQQKARLHDLQQQRQIFDEVLHQIRQLKGHENFLLVATDLNTVYHAAQTVPLVYLFTTDKGGYTLIVFQEKIQAVALPELTTTILVEKVIGYFEAYSSWLQDHNNLTVYQAWFDALEEMTQWLWQVIWQQLTTPNPSLLRRGTNDLSPFLIKEVPEVVAPPLTTKPGVVLIPVGLLNLLPLHAAWRLDDTGHKHYALDDFTITYAPNALSLQKARERASLKPENLLAIDEPKPVDAGALPNSSVEVNAIASHFTQPKIFRHKEATLENVKESLSSKYDVLHFSCHGSANFQNPLETGLLTANNERLTVQHFFDAQLQARLVTLSACETGMIGTKQLEEVVSLPTSLLQAGVAGVVASLWSVSDSSTALLLIKFYENFMKNPDNTAKALNDAQNWLRRLTRADAELFFKNNLLPQIETIYRDKPTTKESVKESWQATLDQGGDYPFNALYHWAAFTATGV